jgi:hypothetical protein
MLSNAAVPVDLYGGVATVDLARLPSGTYKAIEQIDGLPQRTFSFALPLTAPEVVQYEDIVQVVPTPTRFTYVAKINGVSPNPTTGDITVDVSGGASTLDELTDVAVSAPANNQALLFDSGDARWENKPLADVALSGLYSALSGLPTIPNSPDDVGAAEEIHGHSVSQIAGLQAALDTILLRALPDRILRIADHSKQAGGVNTYDMPNTDNNWQLFTDGPAEYTIQAAVGDDVEVSYNYLIAGATTSFVDLAVVTGGASTRQRYLASGISTPTFQGNSANYPSDAGFQGHCGVLGFTVEESDLDSGNVRLRWVIKTANTSGKMYANDNYPLIVGIRVTRRSGI